MAYEVLSPRHIRYVFDAPRESAGLSLGPHIEWARDGLALHALLEFDDGTQMSQTRFVLTSGGEIAFRGEDRDAFLRREEGDHLDLLLFDPLAGLDPDLGLPDEIEDEAHERAGRMRRHLMRERRGAAVERKRRAAAGRPRCEVCGFSFEKAHGALGAGSIECHHLSPIGADVRATEPDDLILICSNCHRMAHRWLMEKDRRKTGLKRLRKALDG